MLISMVLLQLLCLPQVLEHFFQITKDLHKPRIVSNQVVLSKKKQLKRQLKMTDHYSYSNWNISCNEGGKRKPTKNIFRRHGYRN